MKANVVFTAVLLCALSTSVATAAPDPEKRRAAAAKLFEDGIAALQAGRTAEACDKLAESVATLPDSGAKGALAECNTALGRLVEAWQLWRDLASSAPTAELRDDAARNANELDKKLARVVLHVRGVAPGLAVTLNDKPFVATTAIEYRVLPGPLVVVAESPEIERWTQTFEAVAGARLDVQIQTEVSHSAMDHRRHGRRIAWGIMGGGVLAIGVGAVFGGAAWAASSSASSSCGGDVDHCKSAGYLKAQSDLDSARSRATISSWAFGAGAVALGAGLLVYYVYREPHRETATAWRAAPMTDGQTVGLTLTRSLP